MKKYIVKDFNGVWYKGKFYGQGSEIELSDDVEKSMSDSGVKLEPVKAKPINTVNG